MGLYPQPSAPESLCGGAEGGGGGWRLSCAPTHAGGGHWWELRPAWPKKPGGVPWARGPLRGRTSDLPGGTPLYGMVWYGMVWYGMVWYGMVWYGMVWYGMVWYGMVWYGMLLLLLLLGHPARAGGRNCQTRSPWAGCKVAVGRRHAGRACADNDRGGGGGVLPSVRGVYLRLTGG